MVEKKLKTVTPKAEELCVTFDTGGIENQLYVITDFQSTMEALVINRTNFDVLKKYFKKILNHRPAEKFRKMVIGKYFTDTIVQNTLIETQFEKAMKAFIKLYCASTDPKGDLIEYLKTDNCGTPKNKSVSNYQESMKELMRYSTKLEESRGNLSNTEQKMIVFNSFTIAWQISYKRSQAPVQASTTKQVMTFMNQWFETAVTSLVRHENHLPKTVKLEKDTSEMLREDCSDGTCSLGHRGNLVALNGNNNNINNNMNMNMLNTSDGEGDLEYEISDKEYDLYYHDELFVEYNSHPHTETSAQQRFGSNNIISVRLNPRTVK